MQTLIDELGRLPGVGPKSAQRIAFYLLKVDAIDAKRLAHAIEDAKDRVTWCRRCFNISEGELCAFCLDERRDTHVVCVVEEPRDIVAVERTGEYRGRYHVLQGAISPIEGVGPEQLRVKELARPHRRRGDQRGHPRDEPEHRRRGHRDVPRAAAEAGRAQGDAHCERSSGRRRSRIRRRSDARPRVRRPARSRLTPSRRSAQEELVERRVEADVPHPQHAEDREQRPQSARADASSHAGRTIATTASNSTTIPPGLNASDVPMWPCTAATTARVMPQNGHGIPVPARNGHAIGGCTGQHRPHRRDRRPSPRSRRATRARRARRASAHGIDDASRSGPASRRRRLRAGTRDARRTEARRPSARRAPRAVRRSSARTG